MQRETFYSATRKGTELRQRRCSDLKKKNHQKEKHGTAPQRLKPGERLLEDDRSGCSTLLRRAKEEANGWKGPTEKQARVQGLGALRRGGLGSYRAAQRGSSITAEGFHGRRGLLESCIARTWERDCDISTLLETKRHVKNVPVSKCFTWCPNGSQNIQPLMNSTKQGQLYQRKPGTSNGR